MYTFVDKGNESLTLRPEMTAAVVRSVIEHSLLQQYSTLKLWYTGSFFRYERPQKGRLREFHQYGAECIASQYPESDVELLLLANNLLRAMGIEDYNLLLNSLGNPASREAYKNELLNYLHSQSGSLSEDSLKRLEINPLRILDSKSPDDIAIVQNAPLILDFLDAESRDHFDYVISNLTDLGIRFTLQPRLVRGLDYYSHTVFEYQSAQLGSQDSFGGGGRYNSLFEQLGGKQTPAVGFALGIERLLMIIEQNQKVNIGQFKPDIFIVTTSPDLNRLTQQIAQTLRQMNFNIMFDLQRRSTKAQFREANKSNSPFVIIVGEEESAKGSVQIKNMATGEQSEHKINELGEYNFKV